MSGIIGLIGVLAALALLIVLAYRGFNVIVVAPIAALVAVVFAGAPLMASYTQVFMPAVGGFIISFFPLFLTGAMFGKLMSDTGYARSIALAVTERLGPKRALLATVLTGTIMTYGGISVFVVAFGLFPIALELFRAAQIPRRLIPATIALGAFTYSMSALPGSPQVQNAIPIPYFQTNTYAAPLMGLLAAVIMFTLGMAWLSYRARSAARSGEGFDGKLMPLGAEGIGQAKESSDSATMMLEPANQESAKAPGFGTSPVDSGGPATMVEDASVTLDTKRRHALAAMVPVLIVIGVNALMTLWVFPRLDLGYLEADKYGNATLSQVGGMWAVLVALIAATLYIFAANLKNARRLAGSLNEGARSAVQPIFATGSEVGFGAVIASLPAFAMIRDGLLGISANPLVTSAIATTSLAGVTASASGGMSISLQALGGQLRQMAVDQGISTELLHRVTTVASGGLDTLPHSGAIITLLAICSLTHRQSYKDIAVVTILGPLVATVALLVCGTLFMS